MTYERPGRDIMLHHVFSLYGSSSVQHGRRLYKMLLVLLLQTVRIRRKMSMLRLVHTELRALLPMWGLL